MENRITKDEKTVLTRNESIISVNNLSLNNKLPEDFDYKKEIGMILSKKYLTFENNKDLKPFTIEEFNERIEKSLDDIKNGRVTSQEDLLIEISKW